MRLLLCAALVLRTAVIAMPQQAFRDDFEQAQLDERWEWVVPVEGPEMKLTRKALQVTVPQREEGYNHWTGGEADAPLLLAAAPPGNFALEAHIRMTDFGADSNFHFAICAAPSKHYLVALGPFMGPKLYQMTEPQVWAEPTGRGRALDSEVAGGDVFLRLERRGDTYTCLAKQAADGPWQALGTLTDPFTPAQVGLLFKTFGNGPAVAAEVDYLAAEPLPEVGERPANIRINVEQPRHEVHPHIYGHFIEHLGRCIYGGLWAEMINNRKFAGNVQANGVVESWGPADVAGEVKFSADNLNWYVGGQSQRIELAEGASGGVEALEDAGRGRGTPPLALEAGREYDVRIVARQEGLRSPVRVTLKAGDQRASAEVNLAGGEWQTHELTLTAPADSLEGRLAITAEGPGTFWIGAVSLMPSDNVEGWRRDVLEAVRDLRIPILRWPGGNFVSGYHWHDGIGPMDRRPPRWDRAWNAWEWNDVGTHEFIRLCELLDTEPYICVNAGEADEREAAAWVSYCNDSADSHWGAMRAANGHPEPFGVKYWSIGNEMYGNWQLGHLDAINYALKSVAFVRAMREADAGLKLIVNGVEADGWDGWNRKVLGVVGEQCEYLAVHFYQGVDSKNDPRTNYLTVVSSPVRVERMLARTGRIMEEVLGQGHRVKITFDEWNTWPSRTRPGFSSDYAIADGVFAAGIFHAMIRLGELVTMGNIAQTVNVLGTIQTDRLHVAKTPLALAFQLYAPRTGKLALPVEVECESLTGNGTDCPALDVAATLSEDRGTLYVAVANRHPTQALAARINLGEWKPAEGVEVAQMVADGFDACNPVGEEPQVRIVSSQARWPEAQTFSFPPHSATILTLRAQTPGE
ncbi:MAG: alpha-L-arabinofuranosidase C-terminal domain-containing protein [Armatimonadota bacterium]